VHKVVIWHVCQCRSVCRSAYYALFVAESGSHATSVAAARRGSDVTASDARSHDATDGSGPSCLILIWYSAAAAASL